MNNILKALAKFQKDCPAIKKDSSNPYFKSFYASLDAIQHHIKPHVEKNGLVIVQATKGDVVETTVYHVESSESISSTFPIVVTKPSAQEYGSAVSYAKRYSLSGLLNLIIEDQDDDGEAAMGRNAPQNNDLPWLNEGSDDFNKVKAALNSGYTIDQVKLKYKISKKVLDPGRDRNLPVKYYQNRLSFAIELS